MSVKTVKFVPVTCDCGQEFEIALPAESGRCPACGEAMFLGQDNLLDADGEATEELEEP